MIDNVLNAPFEKAFATLHRMTPFAISELFQSYDAACHNNLIDPNTVHSDRVRDFITTWSNRGLQALDDMADDAERLCAFLDNYRLVCRCLSSSTRLAHAQILKDHYLKAVTKRAKLQVELGITISNHIARGETCFESETGNALLALINCDSDIGLALKINANKWATKEDIYNPAKRGEAVFDMRIMMQCCRPAHYYTPAVMRALLQNFKHPAEAEIAAIDPETYVAWEEEFGHINRAFCNYFCSQAIRNAFGKDLPLLLDDWLTFLLPVTQDLSFGAAARALIADACAFDFIKHLPWIAEHIQNSSVINAARTGPHPNAAALAAGLYAYAKASLVPPAPLINALDLSIDGRCVATVEALQEQFTGLLVATSAKARNTCIKALVLTLVRACPIDFAYARYHNGATWVKGSKCDMLVDLENDVYRPTTLYEVKAVIAKSLRYLHVKGYTTELMLPSAEVFKGLEDTNITLLRHCLSELPLTGSNLQRQRSYAYLNGELDVLLARYEVTQPTLPSRYRRIALETYAA